jgi:aminopeptidase N
MTFLAGIVILEICHHPGLFSQGLSPNFVYSCIYSEQMINQILGAMRKLFFMILLFPFCHCFAQAPNPGFIEKMALSEGRAYQKSATFIESDDYADYDLIYQRLNFQVDPAVRQIEGSVFSKVKFLKSNITKIRFDLTDSLMVDSVKCSSLRTTFKHSGNKLAIDLLMPMGINSVSTIEVYYHGTPLRSGFGSFAVEKHNGVPVLWTLSEPYGALEWWPCKQSLADKIDSIDVFVTCPSQYKAASNGKLISDQENSGTRTAHWRHRYPIATYLVAIAVTNYEKYSDFLDIPEGKKIEVLNYVYPEYLETAKIKSADILDILDFYNTKFITYPFASEKYGHAQFGWDGGMEHQTMSFMHDLDFELVAHEMAHQWFGDYITLASWHDIWLNEGFATYLTGLVFENLQDGYWWPIWKNNLVSAITSSSGGSVYVADTTNVNRIFSSRLSYSKGAYLLQMLRWEMGDENFFRGMKSYLTDPSVANGFASQDKFVKQMENAAGTSFNEFFKDWYYGEGYPVYLLSYYTDYSDYGKQILQISQTPTHGSVDFFEMHVPVRVWKNGSSNDLRLFCQQQNQEFVISETRIDSIQFDPDKWLIAKAGIISDLNDSRKVEPIKIIPEYAARMVRVILPDFSGIETIRFFDLNGRMVLNGRLSGVDSRVDVSSLRSSFYIVEIQAVNQRKTGKFLLSPFQAE